jgi:hypothetical protein
VKHGEDYHVKKRNHLKSLPRKIRLVMSVKSKYVLAIATFNTIGDESF